MVHNIFVKETKEYIEFHEVHDILKEYVEEVKKGDTEKLKEVKAKLEVSPEYVAYGQNLWIIHDHRDDEYLLDLFDKGVKKDPITFLAQDCDQEFRQIYLDLGCQQKRDYWVEALSSFTNLAKNINKILVGIQGNIRILFTNIDDLNGSVIIEKATKLKNNEYAGQERYGQYAILTLAVNTMCIAQIRDNKELLKIVYDMLTEDDIESIGKLLSSSKVINLIKEFLKRETYEDEILYLPFFEVAE